MAEPSTEIPDLPGEEALGRLIGLAEPLLHICRPKLYGLEKVADDGALLVGNHTRYGMLDLPFMMAEIWKRRRGTRFGSRFDDTEAARALRDEVKQAILRHPVLEGRA